MSTQVLRPQDCLIHHRIRLPPPPAAVLPRRRHGTPNVSNTVNTNVFHSDPKPTNRKPAPRKRSKSEPALPSSNDAAAAGGGGNGLVMEKVTLLRRGESLDSKMRSSRSGGPEPGTVPTHRRIVDPRSPVGSSDDDVLYAGSAFAVSPAPSSLPLPSFSKKKHSVAAESATRDLRRILRLD